VCAIEFSDILKQDPKTSRRDAHKKKHWFVDPSKTTANPKTPIPNLEEQFTSQTPVREGEPKKPARVSNEIF